MSLPDQKPIKISIALFSVYIFINKTSYAFHDMVKEPQLLQYQFLQQYVLPWLPSNTTNQYQAFTLFLERAIDEKISAFKKIKNPALCGTFNFKNNG